MSDIIPVADDESAEIETRLSDFSGESFPATDEWREYELEDSTWGIHASEVDDFESEYAECPVRETWHRRDDMYETAAGDLICPQERHDNWIEDYRGDLILKEDAEVVYAYINGHWREARASERDASANFSICTYYQEYYPDEGGYHTDGGDWYSERAVENGYLPEEEEQTAILPYSSTEYPPPVGKADEIHFGVEVEVEVSHGDPEDRAQDILHHVPHVICKSDGSLDNGFEIVSAPATLEAHRKIWPHLKDSPSWSSLQSWDNSNCGMHVHIERKGLTPLQLGRMLVFINDDFNRNFMRKVAGRDSAKWAKKSKKKLSDGKYSDAEKYVALSLRKRETVELRVFRGTIQPGHILRNVEFCDALVKFCAPASRSFAEAADHRELIKFVDTGRKDWPELHRWMVAQGWVKSPSKKPKPEAVAEDDVTYGGIEAVTPADLSPASPCVTPLPPVDHPVNDPRTGLNILDCMSVECANSIDLTPENGWHRLPVSYDTMVRHGDAVQWEGADRREWCIGFAGRSTQDVAAFETGYPIRVYRWSPPGLTNQGELDELWRFNRDDFSEVDAELPVMAGDCFIRYNDELDVAGLATQAGSSNRAFFQGATYGGRPVMRYTPRPAALEQ